MRTLSAILITVAVLTSAADAQDPFETIHYDILQKMDAERASMLSGRHMLKMPDPTPGQLLYDVLHYDIYIAINEISHSVEGRVAMTIESLADSIHTVDINADNALVMTAVAVDGSPAPGWGHAAGILTVDLPVGLAAGEQAVVEISYTGNPDAALVPGLFFRMYGTDHVVYSLSQPWSARAWWPCKDYPDDKATFDIRLAVDPALFAASNGEYIGESDTTHWGEPYKCYQWRENYPMSNYLFSVAASVYVRLDDHFVYAPGETMMVTHYVYPDKVTEALADFSITVPALEFFSTTFGMYPFVDEKYGVALCSLGGGMEHQTLTSYGASLVSGTHHYDWVYVHELAHMWFGDMVTCSDWTHTWLNEGWASYCEALWFEHVSGPAMLKSYMEGKDTPGYWNGPLLRDPENDDPWYYFDTVVYHKGAWVLHMLRHIMGDGPFFDAARAYLADPRYSYSYANTDDMKAVFEDHHGSSLDWFFTPWLTREDRPQYELTWDSYGLAADYHLAVAVRQVQPAGVYVMPVDFRITTWSETIDTVLWIDEEEESFHFVLGDPLLSVELDPDHWVLRDITETVTGDETPPSASFISQNVPNPFNPVTSIMFGLREAGNVTLKIYDVSGSLVRILASGRHEAGIHEVLWNGTNDDGRPVASGVYLYSIRSGELFKTKKMVLIR